MNIVAMPAGSGSRSVSQCTMHLWIPVPNAGAMYEGSFQEEADLS